MRHELRLPHDPSAGSIARDTVRMAATGLPREVVEAAVLLASELVTNAVIHGAPQVFLRVDVSAWAVQVEVVDGAGTFSVDLTPPPMGEPAGRGLRIVASLATRWGLREQAGGGKAVWFELAA